MRRVALVTFLSSVAVTVLYGAILITVVVTMGTPLLPIAVNSLVVATLAAACALSGVWVLIEFRVRAPAALFAANGSREVAQIGERLRRRIND